MASLFRFSPRCGRERSLLALYILHTLKEHPEAGYDLIKEIGTVTGGAWEPSKSTLYPLLRHLEEEGLITVAATEKRSKTLFVATDAGRETLSGIQNMGKEQHRKMAQYKQLLIAVFGGSEHSVKGLLFGIRDIVEEIPPGKEKKVIEVLEQCKDQLTRIASS